MHSICQQIWKTQQWPQDWKRLVFIPIPKKSSAKNVQTTTWLYSFQMLASLYSKSFKQYMYWQCPVVQDGFQRGSRTRDQVANIHPIMELAREYQKNIYLCFIDYAKAFNRVDHKNLWKILKKIGVPDCVTCLLRNLYVGQEAAVRTGRGTTDLFKLGKVIWQGCILSPCLFNFYVEYIMMGWMNHKLESSFPG